MSRFISNSFPLPNAVIDELVPNLSDAALRCYMVITRQTTGWNKNEDRISITQFMKKTGRSRNVVIKGCKELCSLNLIKKTETEQGNIYELITSSNNELGSSECERGVVQNVNGGSSECERGVVQNVNGGSSECERGVVQNVNTQNNTNTKNTKQNNTNTNKENTKRKFSAIDELKKRDVDEQLANDFLDHRKMRKSPVTNTVINIFEKEGSKVGMTLSQTIEYALSKSWTGFRAEWVRDGYNVNVGTAEEFEQQAKEDPEAVF